MKKLGVFFVIVGLLTGPLITVVAMIRAFNASQVQGSSTDLQRLIGIAMNATMIGIPLVLIGIIFIIVGRKKAGKLA